MSNTQFVQNLQRLEVDIRGLYLSIACDIEICPNRPYLLYCRIMRKENGLSLFRKVLFEKKIKMAEEVLKWYSEQHFNINEPSFKKFHELKEYRNICLPQIKGDPNQVTV